MNPIKSLREKHGITQSHLADHAGMTIQAVRKYENGLYETPSKHLVDALVQLTGQSPSNIRDEYTMWRVEQQESARRFLTPKINLSTLNGVTHPFIQFRNLITNRAVGRESRMALCNLLAIHPAVVQSYEEAKQAGMPPLIWGALRNAGCTEEYLRDLEMLGEIYFERHVSI